MNFKDAYYPTRGVKTDFSNLLEKFIERKTVRYQPFAEVWRSMKFSYLGAGRKSDAECREFFEEVNHIALIFYLPPYNFQVRVGGLYILYGLYITQSCVPKVPIRVTYEQWKQIQEFQANARKQQHLDVEYVFQKLFCHNAFLFVATPHEVYIKAKDRDRHERGREAESVLSSNLKDVAVSVPKVFTPEIMQQLQAIHTQYQHLKLGIAGPNALRPDRSLAVVEDDIITNVDECLSLHRQKLEKIRNSQKGRNLKRKQEDSDSGEPGDSDADDPDFTPVPKSAQARVKEQAYSQKAKQSKGRRHRNVLTQDASASSPEKNSRRADKTRKDPKDSQEEDEEETFLSSSVEESSENVLSPQEYLSMPSLEDTGSHQPETLKSKKTVRKAKCKTETQSPKTKNKKSAKQSTAKKAAKKSKDSEPVETDTTGGGKAEAAEKKSTKKKTKANSSKTKLKVKLSPVKKGKKKQSVEGEVTPEEPAAKVKKTSPKARIPGPSKSPVKKIQRNVKGKRKQSVEGEVTPGEPVAKVKKMPPKDGIPGPSGSDSTKSVSTPSKDDTSTAADTLSSPNKSRKSVEGVTKTKSQKASPAKSPFKMKIVYKH